MAVKRFDMKKAPFTAHQEGGPPSSRHLRSLAPFGVRATELRLREDGYAQTSCRHGWRSRRMALR
ncbi:MAG TPA: hypothetical protein VE665_09935, partial [Hyphomicrobiaceae bacterium]|nr:hypothetical protein [Hyphomicrobiaceae bacterium]